MCIFFYYFIKQYNGSILILNTKISLIANVLITFIIEQIVKKQATINQNSSHVACPYHLLKEHRVIDTKA